MTSAPMTHCYRTGCDLVELTEIENSVFHFGQRYLNRVFTESELADCAGPSRIGRLAARFAAKEAVVKAFATPGAAFAFHEIEVVLVGSAPTLRISGATRRLADAHGWIDTSLSLSHANCHAMAVVVVTVEPKDEVAR